MLRAELYSLSHRALTSDKKNKAWILTLASLFLHASLHAFGTSFSINEGIPTFFNTSSSDSMVNAMVCMVMLAMSKALENKLITCRSENVRSKVMSNHSTACKKAIITSVEETTLRPSAMDLPATTRYRSKGMRRAMLTWTCRA